MDGILLLILIIMCSLISVVMSVSGVQKRLRALNLQQDRLRQKQREAESDLRQMGERCKTLEKGRTAAEAEVKSLLDAQLQLRLEAIEAGKSMLREAISQPNTRR